MDLGTIIDFALKEDIPNGDLTTDALGCQSTNGRAKLIAKEDLVLSGTKPFELTFSKVDVKNQVNWAFKDGDKIVSGSEVCVVTGLLSSLLKAERTALNFLGHLSGISTLTAQFVKETMGSKTKIIDTRKTTPGLRELEKLAVLHGGGQNHRMNLSDGILLKENHIRAAGSITVAVEKLKSRWKGMPIEVEVTNQEELAEALSCGVERILLDNMDNAQIEISVARVNNKALIEASGNMTLDRIKSVAKLGVNFISVGKLTHSAPNADFSLIFSKGTL